MITAQNNPKRHTISPFCWICEILNVKAWDRVPVDFIRNICECCGYNIVEELPNVYNSINTVSEMLYQNRIFEVMVSDAVKITVSLFLILKIILETLMVRRRMVCGKYYNIVNLNVKLSPIKVTFLNVTDF